MHIKSAKTIALEEISR